MLLVFQALHDFAVCLLESALLHCLAADSALTCVYTTLLVSGSDFIWCKPATISMEAVELDKCKKVLHYRKVGLCMAVGCMDESLPSLVCTAVAERAFSRNCLGSVLCVCSAPSQMLLCALN